MSGWFTLLLMEVFTCYTKQNTALPLPNLLLNTDTQIAITINPHLQAKQRLEVHMCLFATCPTQKKKKKMRYVVEIKSIATYRSYWGNVVVNQNLTINLLLRG